METVVGATGVETTLRPAPGDLAFQEGEIRLSGQHTFQGQGLLTFGEESDHALRFSTVEAGHLAPSALSGVMAGAVSWKVDGGSGRFERATGFISSTFTLNESGELSEYQSGLIFVAD